MRIHISALDLLSGDVITRLAFVVPGVAFDPQSGAFPMPPILSKPSGAAPTSLVFITIGAMLTVWAGLWFFYLRQNPPSHNALNYVDAGFLLTGIVLLGIGFGVGPMSRMARQAELPPSEMTPTVAANEEVSRRV